MNCVAINSKRDVEFSQENINYLNINKVNGNFKIIDTNDNLKYKCKMNMISLRATHKITDSQDKTIAKFYVKTNEKILINKNKGYNLYIIPKSNEEVEKEEENRPEEENEKEEGNDKGKICIKVNPIETSSSDARQYLVEFFNKAHNEEETLEIVDRTTVSSNHYLKMEYNIYDKNKMGICKASQSYSFKLSTSLDISPGVEPLFMTILHFSLNIYNSFLNILHAKAQ